MDIIIRRPKKSDKEEIHRLFEKTIKHTFESENAGDEHELIKELINDQKELIDQDFASGGKEPFFLVAEHNGKIAGTICHRLCSNIIIDCSGGKARGMHEIGSVYILPEFQQKGLGRLLLKSMYITLIANGFEEFWLDSGYAAAKIVWRKVLGEPTIIMENYWGEGISHHIWHRKLDEVKFSI